MPAVSMTASKTGATQSTATQNGAHQRVQFTNPVRCCHRALTPWPNRPTTSSHAGPVTATATRTTNAAATRLSTTSWDCCTDRRHLIFGAVRRRWKDVHRAQAVPKEFRDDVVRVARDREPGLTIKQIANDVGIAESCLRNWLRQADVEDGVRPGPTTAENAEPREARKRIPLLEQENEVLRRAGAYLSQANSPGK
jgi:transposase